MIGDPLPVKASFKAVLERIKITFDANIFPRETHKVSDFGMTNKDKMVLECDGKGKMRIRPLRDPLDTIRKLDELRKEGRITQDDYDKAKERELKKLGDS